MADYIRLRFQPTNEQETAMLIALLEYAGLEGFEEQEDALLAFLPEAQWDSALLEQLPAEWTYTIEKVPHENWNQQWEQSFAPVRVGHFCGIRADFHPPLTDVQHELIITPKMSFGTGHHATTCLMIEQMAGLNITGKSVADFGTGTGVLAILAEKMGASTVYAVDNDPNSIENAGENAVRNGCLKIQPEWGETLPEGGLYDLILANIIRSVILENMPAFTKHLTKNGVLVVSGLFIEDEEIVIIEAEEQGFTMISCKRSGNWSGLRFEK